MSYYAYVPNPAALLPVTQRGLFGLGASTLTYEQQMAAYNKDLAAWQKEKKAFDKAHATWLRAVHDIDAKYATALRDYQGRSASYAQALSTYNSKMPGYSRNLAQLKAQNVAKSQAVAAQYGLSIPANFECVSPAANAYYNTFDCTVVKGIGALGAYNLYGSACGARNLPVCNYPAAPKHPGSAPVAPKKGKYPKQPRLRAKPVPPTAPPPTSPPITSSPPVTIGPPITSSPPITDGGSGPTDDASSKKAKMIKGGIIAAVVVVGGVAHYRTFR